MVGLVGVLLSLTAHLDDLSPTATGAETVLYAGLMLGMFGFLVVVFVLSVLGRYTLRSIAVPALSNSIMTSTATMAAVSAIDAWQFAVWIGIVIGFLVAQVLCVSAARWQRISTERGTY